MSIKSATKEKVAVIELSPEDEAKLAQINPDIFLGVTTFPKGIYLAISEEECLSEEGRNLVKEGILKTQ